MMFVMKRIICSKSWKTYSNSDPVSQLRAQACKSFLKQIPLQEEPEVMNSDMHCNSTIARAELHKQSQESMHEGYIIFLGTNWTILDLNKRPCSLSKPLQLQSNQSGCNQ